MPLNQSAAPMELQDSWMEEHVPSNRRSCADILASAEWMLEQGHSGYRLRAATSWYRLKLVAMPLEAVFCRTVPLEAPLRLLWVGQKGQVVSLGSVMRQATLATAASWRVHGIAQNLV